MRQSPRHGAQDDRTLATLRRTVTALHQAEDAAHAFGLALDAVMDLSGADMGAVFRPAGTSLRLAESRSLPQAFRRRPPLLDAAKWGHRRFLQAAGAPEEPAPAGEAIPLGEAPPLAALPAWATVPVTAHGTLHGLLLIGSRDLVGFSKEAQTCLELVAEVLGLAVHALPAPRRGPPPVPTQVGPPPEAGTHDVSGDDSGDDPPG